MVSSPFFSLFSYRSIKMDNQKEKSVADDYWLIGFVMIVLAIILGC